LRGIKLQDLLRYFVKFSYFGGRYHGWQKQPNAITVQEVLENAFTTILRDTIVLAGAGRTDTGVHAKEMFAHFDIAQELETGKVVHRLNSLLPKDIAVAEIFAVKEDVHARFTAVERSYEYHVATAKNPFLTETACIIRKNLDVAKMNAAAQLLLGTQDFECFSKSKTQVYTNMCTITEAIWVTDMQGNLTFKITANRFLRNMVRAIVGTLLDVGQGTRLAEEIKTIIASKSRANAGVSVPAKGLFLTAITYPNTIFNNG